MADANTGMDVAEMKKLLAVSKKQPVNCGLGLTKDGVVFLMHKIKPPRALVKDLQGQFSDMKSPGWGTAFVDTDADAKLIILQLEKSIPGVARKLKKTLKGTGFSKVEVRLGDGSVAEAAGEEDEDDASAPASAADAPQDADAAAAAAPPADAPAAAAGQADAAPDTAGGPDQAALTKQLTDLVGRIAGADPSQAATLKGFALAAAKALKSNDLAAAQSAITELQQRLDQAPAASPADPAPDDTSSAPQAGPNVAAIGKAKLAWAATRKKVEGDLDKLHTEMASAYKDHGFGADLDKFFRAKVEPVLNSLDDSLSSKLDEVTNNSDPSQQIRLVGEAKQILQKYQSYIAGEPLIAKLDENPFVPLQISKTLSATLSALARVIN